MNLEREGKSMTDIRRAIETRYDPKNGQDTQTPWPSAAKGKEQ